MKLGELLEGADKRTRLGRTVVAVLKDRAKKEEIRAIIRERRVIEWRYISSRSTEIYKASQDSTVADAATDIGMLAQSELWKNYPGNPQPTLQRLAELLKMAEESTRSKNYDTRILPDRLISALFFPAANSSI